MTKTKEAQASVMETLGLEDAMLPGSRASKIANAHSETKARRQAPCWWRANPDGSEAISSRYRRFSHPSKSAIQSVGKCELLRQLAN